MKRLFTDIANFSNLLIINERDTYVDGTERLIKQGTNL